MLIKDRFQTTVTVLISFELTRWIINEFENVVSYTEHVHPGVSSNLLQQVRYMYSITHNLDLNCMLAAKTATEIKRKSCWC